jgi:hypothetical protein
MADQYILSHQMQALTFMLGRERGWNLCGPRHDVWRSYIDRFGRARYALIAEHYNYYIQSQANTYGADIRTHFPGLHNSIHPRSSEEAFLPMIWG